ncbi:hypothetical protein CP8484711_0489B, partial [Chlamydia psittaci 84-8471/1]
FLDSLLFDELVYSCVS